MGVSEMQKETHLDAKLAKAEQCDPERVLPVADETRASNDLERIDENARGENPLGKGIGAVGTDGDEEGARESN